MKYTIEGFSQAYAMTLKKEVEVNGKTKTIKIDCTDLVILRWFVDFYPNMKKIDVDGVQYAWLTHKKLLTDLPLIDISKRAFIERMQKLVEFGILSYKLLKEGGTFSLYGFGENYKNLINDDTKIDGVCAQPDTGYTFEQHRGIRSNDIGGDVQTYNKDTSINDTSINDSSISDREESKTARRQPKASFDALIKQYSKGDPEVERLLGEWLKVRKAKRAAMTDYAIELNLKKMDALAAESCMSVTEYLKEVICRGWNAFYAINNYNNGGSNYGRNQQSGSKGSNGSVNGADTIKWSDNIFV